VINVAKTEYQYWSEEEEAIATKLWKRGISIKEISQVLGRSYTTVNSKITALELREEPPRPKIDYALLNLLMEGEPDEI